jgi:hypothetical protein
MISTRPNQVLAVLMTVVVLCALEGVLTQKKPTTSKRSFRQPDLRSQPDLFV